MSGPCLAWALGAQAIAHKLDMMPLPKGTSEAVVGRWRLIVNNTELELIHSAPPARDVELPPFELYCQHLDFFSFGLLGPNGGMIGGYTEERFIADLIPHLSKESLVMFGSELESFAEYQELKGKIA